MATKSKTMSRMPGAMELKLAKLRRFNLYMGIMHFIQGIFMWV